MKEDTKKPDFLYLKLNKLTNFAEKIKQDCFSLKSEIGNQQLKNKVMIETLKNQFLLYLQTNTSFKSEIQSSSNINKQYMGNSIQVINLQWTNQQLNNLQQINKIHQIEIVNQKLKIDELKKQVDSCQKQLLNKDRIINRIIKENQSLNQTIFDFEQKIVQIDIQIQKKVGIRQSQYEHNLKSIQQLKQVVQKLQKKSQIFKDEQLKKSNDLDVRQQFLDQKLQEFKQKEQNLYIKLKQLEKQKQKLGVKENQVYKMQKELQRRLKDVAASEKQIQIIKHQLNENYKTFNNKVRKTTNYDFEYSNHEQMLRMSNLSPNKNMYSIITPNKGDMQNNKLYLSEINKLNSLDSKKESRYYVSNVSHQSSRDKKVCGIEQKLLKLKSEIRRQIDSIN